MTHRNARRTVAWFLHGTPEVASFDYLIDVISSAGYEVEYMVMGEDIYIEAEDMSRHQRVIH